MHLFGLSHAWGQNAPQVSALALLREEHRVGPGSRKGIAASFSAVHGCIQIKVAQVGDVEALGGQAHLAERAALIGHAPISQAGARKLTAPEIPAHMQFDGCFSTSRASTAALPAVC